MCNCQRSVICCLWNYPFLNMTKMCCFGFLRPGSLRYSWQFYKSDRLYNIANHISENKVLNMENLRFYFSKLRYHETKPEVLYPQTDPDLDTDTLLNTTEQEAMRMSADSICWSSLSVEDNRARSCCLAQKQCVTYPVTSYIFPLTQMGMMKTHSVSANELNLVLGKWSARWNVLLREIEVTPSLKLFRAGVDEALRKLAYGRYLFTWQWGWNWMIFNNPSNPNHSISLLKW